VSLLDSSVLVLNRHYQPVHVTSVKRAFSLLYMGAARVIDGEYRTFDFESWAVLSAAVDGGGNGQVVHTIDRVIRVPRVILLQLYDRMPTTKVRFSRLNIYARDDNTCQYCGQKLPRSALNLDHVQPRSQGGRTTWENVVCCCVPCNLRKGARTPQQAAMKLLHSPERPRWNPTFRGPGGRVRYREWLPFLGVVDASYWNTELLDEED
jgi:5-methylcytosine-specific restriction endonuclease McrA